MSLRRIAAWLCAAALLAARPAAGAEHLSDYEKESLRTALEEVGGEIDPAPGQKWVEGVEVVTLDVIEPRDPAPGILNLAHATTRPWIIEQEVLLRKGDRYDAGLVAETERNLRDLRQLSVVLVVPLRGSTPDRVRLLVVTKDVWSLRLNWEPVFVNGNLQSLYLQPSEENLLGRHKTLNFNLLLDPATYSLGVGFIDPRIAGTRLAAGAVADLTVNCRTGNVEGSDGTFSYGKPLYSTRTRWGWVTAAAWTQGIARPLGVQGLSVCSNDLANPVAFLTPHGTELVPYEYHRDVFRGQLSAVRSYGLHVKNDISFGLEADRRVYRPPDLSGYSVSTQVRFRRLMPVSDTRLSPFVQLHNYQTRFLRVLNLETMGLQEDYLLGPEVYLRAYPAAKAVGSTRNLLGLYGAVAYTVPFIDGLARAYAASSIQLSNPDQSDAVVLAGARIVTPQLPFGRVIVDGYYLDRVVNYLNTTVSLGGTTRLRGYRTQAFAGPNVAILNTEIRSRPIEILHVQVGAVAFYDVGDAFRDASNFHLRRGIGGGLRLAFPQIQRSVFRLDVGVPLDPHDPYGETSVVARFEQAFTIPELIPPGLAP